VQNKLNVLKKLSRDTGGPRIARHNLGYNLTQISVVIYLI